MTTISSRPQRSSVSQSKKASRLLLDKRRRLSAHLSGQAMPRSSGLLLNRAANRLHRLSLRQTSCPMPPEGLRPLPSPRRGSWPPGQNPRISLAGAAPPFTPSAGAAGLAPGPCLPRGRSKPRRLPILLPRWHRPASTRRLPPRFPLPCC